MIKKRNTMRLSCGPIITVTQDIVVIFFGEIVNEIEISAPKKSENNK